MKFPARLFALITTGLLTLLPGARSQPTSVVTTLHSFASTDGVSPNALVQGSDGNFYGTTNIGGSNNDGTLFRLSLTSTSTPTPTVNVSAVGTSVVVETGAKGVVLVTRTGDTARALTVTYKAKGAAAAGVDYKKLSGSITISAGASKVKIKIKPLSGSPNSDLRKVKVVLIAPEDSSYIIGTGTATIKIIGQ